MVKGKRMNDRFTRIKWLVGEEKFQKISQTKVFGLRTWWSGWNLR